ncbi:MAG: alpha/beta fold hydrolase, partial [Stellaceae bacterium]
MSDVVSIAGRRIEYDLISAPQGAPTLVFLHQGLGSLALRRDVPAVLAARTQCGALAYSRLGHGWSDPEPGPRAPDFLIREGRDALPALLDALGVRDVILVGHSDGGTIALTYLAAGHKARSAVVMAPHVFDEAITWREIAAQQAQWPGSLRPRLARYHRNPDATFRAWAEFWLAPAFR